MGRKVRRVPPDWQHPKDERGHHRPLNDCSYVERMADYERDRAAYRPEDHDGLPFAEWDGPPPDPAYYRPAWPEGSATAFQVYENVSEGTPVSPVFATREALIDWLVNDGSGMGIGGTRAPLSRKAAERFADAGYAPSMVMAPGLGAMSGAQFYEHDDKP